MNEHELSALFERCGIAAEERAGGSLAVHSPIDGAELARLHETPVAPMPEVIAGAKAAFRQWCEVPAPARGELGRLWGEELRSAKAEIGHQLLDRAAVGGGDSLQVTC